MKLFGTFWFYFLALGVAAYAVFAYGFMPLGSLVHPDMKLNFLEHKAGIYTHVFASMLALALSPFQFSDWIRRKHLRLHRFIGRTYLGIGVLIGGLSGLYMATFAYGGLVAKLGFACLALCWLFTGARAFLAIRQGNVREHRKWVIRNVALTLAGVMLRIYLPSSMIAHIPFALSYPVIAWLCWVPNILVAEWFFVNRNDSALEPIPK
jgi:uncharacterized membrane protein